MSRTLLTEDDLQLGLRQVLCDTPVLSIAEAKRVNWIEFSMHVELVGVREDVCVAIARLARCYDAGSCFDGLVD